MPSVETQVLLPLCPPPRSPNDKAFPFSMGSMAPACPLPHPHSNHLHSCLHPLSLGPLSKPHHPSSNLSSVLNQDDSVYMEMLLCSSQKQNSSVVFHEPSALELLYHRGLLGPRHKPSQLFVSTALTPTAALTPPSGTPTSVAVLLCPVSSLFPHLCPTSVPSLLF